MKTMGRFIYQARSDSIWVEHELDYALWLAYHLHNSIFKILLSITNFDSAVLPNPEEVCEVKFVSRQELDDMFNDNNVKFSPWFSLFYKFKWLNSWWDNLDNLEPLKEADIHKLN